MSRRTEKQTIFEGEDKIYLYTTFFYDENGKLIRTKKNRVKYKPVENPKKTGRKTNFVKERKYKSAVKKRIADFNMRELNKMVKLLDVFDESK